MADVTMRTWLTYREKVVGTIDVGGHGMCRKKRVEIRHPYALAEWWYFDKRLIGK